MKPQSIKALKNSNPQKAETKSDNNASSKTIQAGVEFGMPSKDCRGLGICRISLHPIGTRKSNLACSCSQTIASMQLLANGQLQMRFSQSSLPTAIIRQQFINNIFIVQESYTLPAEIAQVIGRTKVIRPGHYRIEEQGRYFVVHF